MDNNFGNKQFMGTILNYC